MGNSIHKGYASKYKQPFVRPESNSSMQVFLGHVLEVSYEDPTPGIIRVKLLSVDRSSDDEITRVAYPVDKNIVKYPLPGELVFLFNGMATDTIKDRFGTQLYYIVTITSNNSITFNSNPFYSSAETAKTATSVFTGDYQTRFEKRLVDYASYKKLFGSKEVIERQKLQPLEGDLLIQSRFGSGIRFSSSGDARTGLSLSERIGSPGSPMLVMNVGVKSEITSSRVENVNMDAASIYLCSGRQVVSAVMACSQLLSMKATYNLAEELTETDETRFVDTSIYDEYFERPVSQNTQGNQANTQSNTQTGGGGSQTSSGGSSDKDAEYPENSIEPVTKPINICIGDSQTPYISRKSSKAKTIGEAGQKNLHRGGKDLRWLVKAIKVRQVSPLVKHVVICIGTNGGFNKSEDIPGLFSALRTKFPNAKYLVVKGSWGWGGVSKKTEADVNSYYALFEKQGGIIVPTPIGDTLQCHSHSLPSYVQIAKEIDDIIG